MFGEVLKRAVRFLKVSLLHSSCVLFPVSLTELFSSVPSDRDGLYPYDGRLFAIEPAREKKNFESWCTYKKEFIHTSHLVNRKNRTRWRDQAIAANHQCVYALLKRNKTFPVCRLSVRYTGLAKEITDL